MSEKHPQNLALPPLLLGGGRAPRASAPADALLKPRADARKDSPKSRLVEPLDLTIPEAAAPGADDFTPATAAFVADERPSVSAPPVAAPAARQNTFAQEAPQPTRLPLWARWAYPAAVTLALLWGGPLVAFCIAYQNHYGPFEYAPFPPAVFGALAILPAIFMLLGAFVLRQAAKLSLETHRARAIADELAIPAALAVDQAGGAADAVRREVSRATEAGEAAERQMLSLRQSLAAESDRLVAATEAAERAARALTDSLSRERTGMSALSSSLELQVEAMNDTLNRQTQLVTETSDLASSQIREAQAALAARATDLAAAAGEAGEAAELAGEALARQAERLESVGEIVGGRLQALSDDLGRGHSRLADLAVRLQADQQALSDRLEAQRLSAVAVTAEAKDSVMALTGGAAQAASALRDLIGEAETRMRTLGETVQGEQAALDARARASLALFRDAVADERTTIESETRAAIADLSASAEEARRIAVANLQTAEAAVAAQAEAARAQVEQLGEAAFAAGQKADHALDARVSAARRSIEQSAALVEQAGRQSLDRVDQGLAAARTALGEVEGLLASVDERIEAVPAEAQARAEAVRASVEASLAQISEGARKVAAETEAVDAALQERVRRNYEMLSDALKTMDKVATVTEQTAARAAAQAVAAAAAAAPAPVPPSAVERPPVHAAPPAQPSAPPIQPPVSPTPAAAAFAERAIRVPPAEPAALRPAAPSSRDVGLRPRLRLTSESEIEAQSAPPRPTAAPTVRPAMAPPAARPERPPPITHETLDPFVRRPATASRQEPPPRETTAWTWKDLLSSIDEPPIDDEALAERLISEIEALGLDAATLLPLPQIDAIAAAMQRGDGDAVREAVRDLAPGAVRRLSRRVLTDKVLRAHADRYVRRYEDLLNDSARRDHEGFMTAALLGSDPGRAFLLFDAAVGELH